MESFGAPKAWHCHEPRKATQHRIGKRALPQHALEALPFQPSSAVRTLAGDLVNEDENEFMQDQINKLADGVWPLVALRVFGW